MSRANAKQQRKPAAQDPAEAETAATNKRPRPDPDMTHQPEEGPAPDALAAPIADSQAPILLVLDLDGVICDRARATNANPFLWETHDFSPSNFVIRKRPHLDHFVNFILANRSHFEVMVWSSAKTFNVRCVCEQYFPPGFLTSVWGREECTKYYLEGAERAEALRGATGGKHVAGVHYELTLKDLRSIWDGSAGRWSELNTLLIDDCAVKSSLQPLNAIQPSAYDGALYPSLAEYDADTELLRLTEYLEGCRGVTDVREYVKSKPYVATRAPETNAVNRDTEQEAPAKGKGKGKGKGASQKGGRPGRWQRRWGPKREAGGSTEVG